MQNVHVFYSVIIKNGYIFNSCIKCCLIIITQHFFQPASKSKACVNYFQFITKSHNRYKYARSSECLHFIPEFMLLPITHKCWHVAPPWPLLRSLWLIPNHCHMLVKDPCYRTDMLAGWSSAVCVWQKYELPLLLTCHSCISGILAGIVFQCFSSSIASNCSSARWILSHEIPNH